jgi:hypothetical protein
MVRLHRVRIFRCGYRAPILSYGKSIRVTIANHLNLRRRLFHAAGRRHSARHLCRSSGTEGSAVADHRLDDSGHRNDRFCTDLCCHRHCSALAHCARPLAARVFSRRHNSPVQPHFSSKPRPRIAVAFMVPGKWSAKAWPCSQARCWAP